MALTIFVGEMSQLDQIRRVAARLTGKSVARPNGTLSGHAAGLPFEVLLHRELLNRFRGRAYRHFELLNEVFLNNPECRSADDRRGLLGPESLQQLLSRGDGPNKSWGANRQFVEKQNDTAETVILPRKGSRVETWRGTCVTLIDVKTKNRNKNSQPPNIISARKLVKACQIAIDHGHRNPFDLVYVGIGWNERNRRLVCSDTTVVSLFRSDPDNLYINWVAASQIQFHPSELDQSFSLSKLTWCERFVESYLRQLNSHIASLKTEARQLSGFLKSV